MLSNLMIKWRGYLIAAGLFVAALFAAYFRGRGKAQQQAELEAKAREANVAKRVEQEVRTSVQERYDVEHQTSRLPDGGSLDELRNDWSRD